MKKKLGVFLIRGAGEEGSKQQELFVDKINVQLTKWGFDPTAIHYEYANWYGPTQLNEVELMNRFLDAGYKKKGGALGRFILYLLSDIVAYTGVPNKPSLAYQQTHHQIYQSIVNLKDELNEGAPLVIIASSLGTTIISDYIWDRRNAKGEDPLGGSPFERMETLTGLFTFGSVIPIYLTAYDIDEAIPIQFPPSVLPEKLRDKAYWGNFFDKNDLMGFPLKPINSLYNSTVAEDVEINSGGIFLSWNPAAHLGYWKTKKIRKRVAEYLRRVLESN